MDFDLFHVLKILIPGEVIYLIVLVEGFEGESIGHKALVTVVIKGLEAREPFAHNRNMSGLGIGHVDQGE